MTNMKKIAGVVVATVAAAAIAFAPSAFAHKNHHDKNVKCMMKDGKEEMMKTEKECTDKGGAVEKKDEKMSTAPAAGTSTAPATQPSTGTAQ